VPSTFNYPGVCVTERPSGAQAVHAAATSIALFVGMAVIGPFNTPTRTLGCGDRFGHRDFDPGDRAPAPTNS
jgi:hypothetical protein